MEMFGKTIKELRIKNNLTQQDLAKALTVSTSTVGKWEGKGNVIPQADLLLQLADYFDVSVDYLLDFKDGSKQQREDRQKEFVFLFNKLNENEQKIVIMQLKGIIANRDNPCNKK